VVAIGGIADGRGMAAAFALGAEGVGMGTRLSMTKESPVNAQCIKMQLESGIEDTIYSNRFDALYCRVLKTPAAEQAVEEGRNVIKGFKATFDIARSLNTSWMEMATANMGGPKGEKSERPKDPAPKTSSEKKKKKSFMSKMSNSYQTAMNLAHMAQGYVAVKSAVENGDLEKGVYLSGQVQGLIHDIPTVAELINRTVAECIAIQKGMANKAL
jgi:enoyl-[acyl-carrier protein] reductase II